MLNLPIHYHFKLDIQIVDNIYRRQVVNPRHQPHKDTQLQSLEIPCSIS